MNTLDSILDGIKIQQQETTKKQDNYLDDVSIFDFSNALQFANQSNNFSYNAIQNNSNDIISQHSVSATPYKATNNTQEHSYQSSLDEAASKYNLHKNSTHNEESSTVSQTKEYSNNNEEATTNKAEHKEAQATSKEEHKSQEVKAEEKTEAKTQEAKTQEAKTEETTDAKPAEVKVETQKVEGEAKKVQVDETLLEEMDTEITTEDTKKAKELLKAQEVEQKAEIDIEVEETKASVKTQDKEVKLEAKVETNVKAQNSQEEVKLEANVFKEDAPVAVKTKENTDAKVDVKESDDIEVSFEEAPEIEVALEADVQGEEQMLFGQKQDSTTEFSSKKSPLPSEIAFSTASKKAAFNKVFSAMQPKTLEESNILNQVIRKVSEKIAQNNPKISISLTPDKLGKVDVDFIQGKNGITAQITAQSDQVKEVLSKNLNNLRDSLASQGVSVSNINIKVEKSDESNEANLDFNQNKEFDMGQQEQAGNSNFADEGKDGNNVAYNTNIDTQEGLDENLEPESLAAKEESKSSIMHEHSTVEYQV